MQRDLIVDLFEGNRDWFAKALDGVPDERMAEQPPGVMNHPAWTLGHCANALDFARFCLGRDGIVPREWREHVKPSSTPVADRSVYASKDELLGTYNRVHIDLAEAVRSADKSMFAHPLPERFRGMSPSIGHLATFMMTTHEAYHVGQLYVWRRAMGLAG
ncbi:MAG: DinB family protein [Planctomycetota bacterium]